MSTTIAVVIENIILYSITLDAIDLSQLFYENMNCIELFISQSKKYIKETSVRMQKLGKSKNVYSIK